MGYEPLRAASVFAGERHSDCGAIKGHFIDLAANLITGPAVLIAAGITGLNHKVRHDPWNSLAIKITLARQLNEVVDSQGRFFRQELDRERAFAGHNRGGHLLASAGERASIINITVASLHRAHTT